MGEIADDIYNKFVDGHEPEHEPEPHCNRCGSTDVYWVFTGVRWKLLDDETNKPHICEANADGFEDLTNEA